MHGQQGRQWRTVASMCRDGREQLIADIQAPLSLYPLAANYGEEVMGGVNDCTALPPTAAHYTALSAELGSGVLRLAGPAVFAWAPANATTTDDVCAGRRRWRFVGAWLKHRDLKTRRPCRHQWTSEWGRHDWVLCVLAMVGVCWQGGGGSRRLQR